MAKSKKSKLRIQVEYILFCMLYGVIYILPLKICYFFSNFLFKLLFLVDVRHRRRTIQHLLHAGIAKNIAEAKRMAGISTREFSKLLVEIIKMRQLYSPDKVTVTGAPEAIAYTMPGDAQGQQVIIITAHYGNWEVAGTAFSDKAQRPMTSLMRAFGDHPVGDLILGHRRGEMHELVDKEDGIRPILRAGNAGRNLTVLIDQHASTSEGVVCEFFGHPARVHMTPALLHLKTGLPIQPEITRRKPGSNFEFEIVLGDLIRYTPTGDKQRDVQRVTQMCVDALEKLIMEDPLQWLWTPRHWLDINRKSAEQYKDWKRPKD